MNELKGKRIVVTGAAGFVGSHLTRRLVAEAADVYLLLRSSSDTSRLTDIIESVTIHEVDLLDTSTTSKVISQIKPEGIFHLAGVSQTFWNTPSVDDMVALNILSTIKLMDTMSEYDYDFFVNTGTFVEVGPKQEPIREDHLCEPTEFYSISRIPATLYAQALGRTHNKPIVTIRIFTPYGPFVQKGKFPYEVITKALTGDDIRLSQPTVTRDFIYIDDLVDLYITAALSAKTHKGEIFNGGSGISTTLGDFIKYVIDYTESKSSISTQQHMASYDKTVWQADLQKVSKLLSWKPDIELEEGLASTIEWFNGDSEYWVNK